MNLENCVALASTFVAIISLVISLIMAFQNHRMIEESTRPSIQIYPAFFDGCAFIVIKNLGNSSAKIDNIQCYPEITKDYLFISSHIAKDKSILSEYLNGSFLAPNCAIHIMLNDKYIQNVEFEFSISYRSHVKKYKETFCFNFSKNFTLDAQPYPGITPKSNETYELHNIVKELRNINNRNL